MTEADIDKAFEVLRLHSKLSDDVLFKIRSAAKENLKYGKSEEKELRDEVVAALVEVGRIIESGEWVKLMECYIKICKPLLIKIHDSKSGHRRLQS
jgi:phage terminase large subunit-like protein